MKTAKTTIPLHRISDFAPQGVSARLYGGEDTSIDDWNVIEGFPIHRDDHYFFLMVEDGSGYLDIDFQRITLKRRELYSVTPGQLHGNINARECKGWVVLVAQEYVNQQNRDILGRNMFRVCPHSITDLEYRNFRDILSLLERNVKSSSATGNIKMIQCLTEAFVMMAVDALESTPVDANMDSRKYHLALQFKELVRENCRMEKSVQFYAGALCVSSGYLNEALKAVTGQPTTYWIQNEILLEAKRLLAATNMTVNEIAASLGYDNYSYFNRLFHEKTGTTPLRFRSEYLK